MEPQARLEIPGEVVDGPHRHSTAQLREDAAALATGLQTRGVGHGDAVAWQLPNWHEAIVLYHACWRLGAVAAPLHHRIGEREVAGQLALLRPKVVFAAPGLAASDADGAIEVRGDDGYEHLLAGGATDPDEPVTRDLADPDDVAVVLFTSGSVDGPKGVLHTHRSLGDRERTMPRVHGLSATDVVLMPAPLAHVSGLLNGVLLPGVLGMKVVLMDRWEPAEALELVSTEGVSFMVGPPTFFVEMMETRSFSPDKVASLRIISCGGTGVTPAFVERASARFGARVKRSYGSTEAPTVTTWHDGDPPARAATTDGRPVEGVELQVVHPHTGAPMAAGNTGELQVRGSGICAGYLGADEGGAEGGDPERACFTTDGWLRTGDLAFIDKEGWLSVVGRSREIIIRGGENITPAEVEAALESHPAVQQAVAVGLPHSRLGEMVAAAVVTDDAFDLETCRTWFAERGVAAFKTPAHLLRQDELPRLGSGKPDRSAVRSLLAAAVDGEPPSTRERQ